jgi:hypothetical protein
MIPFPSERQENIKEKKLEKSANSKDENINNKNTENTNISYIAMKTLENQ